jgi:hypothetical protein
MTPEIVVPLAPVTDTFISVAPDVTADTALIIIVATPLELPLEPVRAVPVSVVLPNFIRPVVTAVNVTVLSVIGKPVVSTATTVSCVGLSPDTDVVGMPPICVARDNVRELRSVVVVVVVLLDELELGLPPHPQREKKGIKNIKSSADSNNLLLVDGVMGISFSCTDDIYGIIYQK